MQKKMILIVSLLFVGTLVSQGQQDQSSFASNSTGGSHSSVFNGRMSAPDYRKPDGPIGSVTENFVYMYAPGQSGANRSLMGWEVVPSLTPAHGFGLQADFESLYMRSIYPGQSWLIMTAGPRFNLAPRSRFTPFIYGEAGEVRLESQRKRNVDWEPVAKAGFGFQSRLTQHFGVTLVPGEWMGLRHDYNGSWDQNFTTRVGLSFYLGRGKVPVS
jgi:hypothetical protein